MSYPVIRFVWKIDAVPSVKWLEVLKDNPNQMGVRNLDGTLDILPSPVKVYQDSGLFIEISPDEDFTICVTPKDLKLTSWKKFVINFDTNLITVYYLTETVTEVSVYKCLDHVYKGFSKKNYNTQILNPGNTKQVSPTTVTSESILEVAYDLSYGKIKDSKKLSALAQQWKQLNPSKPLPLLFNS